MCGVCGARVLCAGTKTLKNVYSHGYKFSWRLMASQSGSKPAPTGIPYTKLTVGIPKESWTNEKRYI